MVHKKIGIFVDAENVVNPALVLPVIRSARNSGLLVALVLCGNWDSPSLEAWKSSEISQELSRHGAIRSPVASMTCEGNIDEVWTVSGDTDFTSLVNRLRQEQIRVRVSGPANTLQGLREACSSFMLLADLRNGKPEEFELGGNHSGVVGVHVRKNFELRIV
jgi:hypothetical protein